jgi:hypothetical protein
LTALSARDEDKAERFKMTHKLSCTLLLCSLTLSPAVALAGDATLAETLFRDGKALMASHDYARACPKLAASYEQDPATGTLFALALCYEESGKLASAWTSYNEVIGRARQEGRADRVQAASERAAALEPQLSKLLVHVPAEVAAQPGFSVTRDGQPLPAAAWETAVPMDPGEHVIEATATSKAAFRQVVTIEAKADQKVVEIPALEGAAGPAAPAAVDFTAPPPTEPKSQVPWRTIGLVVGGAGIVGLGVGAVFGLHAKSLNDDSTKHGDCDASGCNPSGLQKNRDARSAGNVSTVLFIASGALVATGATLFIVGSTKSEQSTASVGVSPLFADSGAGLALHGGF